MDWVTQQQIADAMAELIEQYPVWLNIGFLGNKAPYLDRTVTANPAATLIMDDADAAYQTAITSPHTTVVARFYDVSDTNFWQVFTPAAAAEFLDDQLKGYRAPNLYAMANNEPHTPRDENGRLQVADLAQWEADFIDECEKRGIQTITAFASAKTIEPEQVENGEWDVFLRKLDEKHLLGTNEYALGLPNAHHLQNGLLGLLNPEHPDQWVRTLNFEGNPSSDHDWMFRAVCMMRRLRELGIRTRWYVLECFVDFMADANRILYEGVGLAEYLKRTYGTPDFNGVRSLEAYWRTMFSRYGMTPLDVFEACVRWLVDAMPDCLSGMCIFTVSDHEHWNRNFGLTFDHLDRLIQQPRINVAERNARWYATDPMEYRQWLVTVTAPAGVFVRRAPTIHAEPLGVLQPDDQFIARVSDAHTDNDGYRWRHIEGKGWSAQQRLADGFELWQLSEPVEPEPEPEPEEGGCLALVTTILELLTRVTSSLTIRPDTKDAGV